MSKAAKLPAPVVQEIVRCRDDLEYFAPRHLRVIDKASRKLVPLKYNEAQDRLLTSLSIGNRWLYVLKARQLGSSTFFLSRLFWRALLTPNYSAIVVAHTHDAVQALFKTIHRFYENLPVYLRVATVASSTNELRFEHGGLIRVTTAQSASGRGQSYDAALLSEFAFYTNPEETIATILQTVAPDGEVYLETTPNGLNHAWDLWQRPQGYKPVFLSWRLDPTARLKKLPEGIEIPGHLRDYAKEHRLTEPELNWAAFTLATRCAGNWQLFNQEQAITPETAFVTSGSRVFADLSYPQATVTEGYQEFEAPQPASAYSLGADVAGGSPDGDYSAFVLLNVTDRNNPVIAATWYGKITPILFGDLVLSHARRYDALVTLETNGLGLSLQDYLVQQNYPRFYRRVTRDKIADRLVESVGQRGPTWRIPGRLDLRVSDSERLQIGAWHYPTESRCYALGPRLT